VSRKLSHLFRRGGHGDCHHPGHAAGRQVYPKQAASQRPSWSLRGRLAPVVRHLHSQLGLRGADQVVDKPLAGSGRRGKWRPATEWAFHSAAETGNQSAGDKSRATESRIRSRSCMMRPRDHRPPTRQNSTPAQSSSPPDRRRRCWGLYRNSACTSTTATCFSWMGSMASCAGAILDAAKRPCPAQRSRAAPSDPCRPHRKRRFLGRSGAVGEEDIDGLVEPGRVGRSYVYSSLVDPGAVGGEDVGGLVEPRGLGRSYVYSSVDSGSVCRRYFDRNRHVRGVDVPVGPSNERHVRLCGRASLQQRGLAGGAHILYAITSTVRRRGSPCIQGPV